MVLLFYYYYFPIKKCSVSINCRHLFLLTIKTHFTLSYTDNLLFLSIKLYFILFFSLIQFLKQVIVLSYLF